jgi:flagellar basal body rod protein FlgC
MASDLLSIGRSGVQAARIALDVTAQNISNASSDGYVRRSVRLAEVSSSGGIGTIGDVSLSGVRLDAVVRNADLFRQAEVRRTGADSARADAEVAGLENIQAAVEQSNVYNSMVGFESSLQQLVGDPTSTSLRANVLEDARTMVGTFSRSAPACASRPRTPSPRSTRSRASWPGSTCACRARPIPAATRPPCSTSATACSSSSPPSPTCPPRSTPMPRSNCASAAAPGR